VKGKIRTKKLPEISYLEMGTVETTAKSSQEVGMVEVDEAPETEVVYNDAQIDQLILDAQKDRTEIATIEIYKEVKLTYAQMQAMHKELRDDMEEIRKLLTTK
jgi:hypothetical protein